jgi:DNA-binding NarL/FixJ family response regulator
MENSLARPLIRILVVDDYEPWRQKICSILQIRPELRIVAEVGDGLAAVQAAEELKPDLILLDIGLPKLNGIQAAVRIQQVSRKSKVLFLSEHRSRDIAEEALSTGAGGYVVKSDAGSELLPGIEAVLHGKQFVSVGLTDRNSIDTADRALREKVVARSPFQSVERHELRLYADDTAFVDGLAQSIEATLENRNATLVIVTECHRANLLQKLTADGVDVDSAIERRLLTLLDVADSLSIVTVDAATDENRSAGMPHVIVEAVRTVKDRHRHVAVS